MQGSHIPLLHAGYASSFVPIISGCSVNRLSSTVTKKRILEILFVVHVLPLCNLPMTHGKQAFPFDIPPLNRLDVRLNRRFVVPLCPFDNSLVAVCVLPRGFCKRVLQALL